MAEAVGIVLAIAPLIVSAFENYDNTTRCIRAFRNCTGLIRTHLSTLNIQQTIFRKANERLLNSCVADDDLARRMLADRKHPSWEDTGIAIQYLERLGDCKIAFEQSIELIIQDLDAIRGVLANFESPQGEPNSLLKKRVKYALREGTIERSLASLTVKTRDFMSLIDLTTSSQQKVCTTSCSFTIKRQLSNFCRVKETAEDLYEALSQACTKHIGHRAHLSLEPAYSDPSQVRFTIAFSQLTLNTSRSTSDPLPTSTWLTVESSVSGRIQTNTSNAALATTRSSRKRALDDAKTADSEQLNGNRVKGAKKFLRFEDQIVQAAPTLTDGPSSVPLANLCKHSNFCTQIQRFIGQSQPCRSAVGYLGLSGPSKHLMYIDSKWQTVKQASAGSELQSLHDVLVKPTQTKTGSSELSLLDRIRLVRQLATAVLHFHGTPWLRSMWSSGDVLVPIQGQDADVDAVTPGAYITTQLRRPHAPLDGTQTPPSPLVVRNQLLFSLGVMLVELAFQQPLSALVIDSDKDASNAGNTAYCAANRLSRQISAYMGPRYAEIARKCVHCDFGCDFDLQLAKLQEGFYQDVVCELDKLEQSIQEM